LEPIEMSDAVLGAAGLGDCGLCEAEIQRLSLEMEAQLLAVQEFEAVAVKKGLGEGELVRKRMALQHQWAELEAQTKEPTDSFLQRFGRVTRRDICEEGGLLNQQWKTYQDLSRSSTVQVVAVGGGIGDFEMF
jgi:flagella basal body P-ring formation protein FlgA